MELITFLDTIFMVPGTYMEVAWSKPGDTAPVNFIRTTFYKCSFCDDWHGNEGSDPKHGWHICNRQICQAAATAQRERVVACLIDCPETRRAALEWVKCNASG